MGGLLAVGEGGKVSPRLKVTTAGAELAPAEGTVKVLMTPPYALRASTVAPAMRPAVVPGLLNSMILVMLYSPPRSTCHHALPAPSTPQSPALMKPSVSTSVSDWMIPLTAPAEVKAPGPTGSELDVAALLSATLVRLLSSATSSRSWR